MKKNITYSTYCHIYYTFGSYLSKCLHAKSIKDLKYMMKCENTKDVEVITFSPIEKTMKYTFKGKGFYKQKCDRITNVYLKNTDLDEYYTPLK